MKACKPSLIALALLLAGPAGAQVSNDVVNIGVMNDQSGVYEDITGVKAVEAAGTDEAKAVSLKMRELPINDFYNKNVRLRRDGRLLHGMYLVQVKSPQESKYRFDDYKVLSVLPGKEAYWPENEGGRLLVAQTRWQEGSDR